MTQEKLAEGDLLYHAVHGLCRVDRMAQESHSGTKSMCYSLVPKITTKMKMRFVIGIDGIAESGFHPPVSVREANQILDYLKTGAQPEPSNQKNETWDLAQSILSISQSKMEAKEQRKRQLLDRSVKGLLGELAFVFNMSLKATAARIQKSLGNVSKINPLVINALANASEN